MQRFMVTTICVGLAAVVFSQPARADFFQYEDKDGTVVMVDDEGKIPPQYRKKTRSTKSAPVRESKVTPVRARGNQAIVPVRISYRNNAVDTWLLLDTGATVSVISRSVADRLGIGSDSGERRLSQLADGRVIETTRLRVDSLAVGPKVKYNAEIAVIPSNGPEMGFDGLLGMNFLSDFRYHVDVSNQVIEWQ